MDEMDERADLIHAARNCTQMLYAMDRRMKKVSELLEQGDLDAARSDLAMLEDAIPQAIAIIDHDKRRKEAEG